MTWVKHTEVHACPTPPASRASWRDLWRCDECGRVWRRTDAHSDHELTGRFAAWHLARFLTWKSQHRAARKTGR